MAEVKVQLRSRVTCPHCWHRFAPEDVLWVAAHPDLNNDPRLGPDQQLRFLPTRFTIEGNALDPRGLPCQELACPQCHLSVPRAVLEMAPLFTSIAGSPSCGKSYFLASMTWRLRQVLAEKFAMTFSDADLVSNRILNQYEEDQFLNPNQDALVRLAKTEEQGDLYDTVRYGDQVVTYPRPFLFLLRPAKAHPRFHDARKLSRLVCLYDNAGESFQPGKDTLANPVTRHLAYSNVLFFCFDPTQDPRFRRACQGKTEDVQVTRSTVTARQEILLNEIADRVRKYTGLQHTQRHTRPLVVIVTKYDAWWPLLGVERLPDPFVAPSNGSGPWGLNLPLVQETSDQVRKLLQKFAPELTSAAEGFARNVLYVPVSATGRGPEVDPATGQVGVRPRDIKPMWCETPMLAALAGWVGGLVPYLKKSSNSERADARPAIVNAGSPDGV